MIKSFRALTISSYIAMLFLGVANSLIGSAAHQMGLSPTEIGFIIASQNAGFALGVVVSGNLADTYPKPRLLLVGSLILGLSLLAFYRTPIFWVNCLVMFGVGTGIGSYEGVTDAMLIDLYPGHAPRYINLNHFWVSVGKVGLAVYLMFLILNWQAAVKQAGVAVLLLAAFFALAYLPARGRAPGDSVARIRMLLKERTFAVLFVIVVLAVGVESVGTGIMTTFLTDLRGFTASSAQVGLIVFLTGVGLGRLLAGLLTKSEHTAQYAVGLLGLCVPLYSALFFVQLGPTVTWLAIFAAGLGLSGLPAFDSQPGRNPVSGSGRHGPWRP